MVASILTIVGLLLTILFWFIKRSAAKQADPAEQNRQRYATADQDIAAHDSNRATAHANADLDELERLRRAQGGSHPS